MKKFVLLVFFPLLLCCCSDHPEKPNPFLSEKQMVELLTEVMIIESSLQTKQNDNPHFSYDSIALLTNFAFNDLFERFGITKESFEANLLYRTYFSRSIERISNKVNENIKFHFDLVSE